MPFRVVIEEVFPLPQPGQAPLMPVKRFEQVVDVIDLPAVCAAISKPPRKPRVRKPKADPA